MARRNATSTTQDQPVDTEATAPESTDTEAPQAEAQDTNTPAESTDTEAPKAEVEVDLTAFEKAVTESLEEGDPDIGTLPVIAKERVASAFRALDGQKAKNKAKAFLDDGVKKSIIGRSLAHARSYTEMRDAVNEATSTKAPTTPADPKTAYVNRLAGLYLATSIVGDSVPEGVDGTEAKDEAVKLVESLGEQVVKLKAWNESTAEDKGDAPDVSPVVKSAFKLASGKAAGSTGGKVGGSTGGPRKDVAKHVTEAFADKASGDFLKISEISNFTSEEYGPNDHPSQGAVSARLFPTSGKCTIEGVEPVAGDKDKGQPRGARKA